jgi:hypothetical protein
MKKIKFIILTLGILAANLGLKAQDNTLSFSVNTDNAQIASSSALSFTGPFTMEAWIYPTGWQANPWQGTIIAKEVDGTSNNGYAFRCGGSGILNIAINHGVTSWTELSTPANALVLNTWQHVAVVFDGSALFLYVNGIQQATGPAPIAPTANTTNVGIGQWTFNPTGRPFLGKIDEVRMWNTSLSAGVISSWQNKSLTNCHPNYANLVGYYQMDSISNAAVLKATVGADGTVSGAVYGATNNASFIGAVTGFQSITASQVPGTVNPNTIDNAVIGIAVETFSPMDITQLVLRTDGTTNVADISNAKIWCTGSSNVFAAATQFGSTIAIPPAAGNDMVFNGTYAMGCGTYYFWLTYDIAAVATIGDSVDAILQSAVVDGISRTPVVSDPPGRRPINTCNSPSFFTVTGGGSLCTGSAGLAIGLNGSQTGVTYQLYNGVTPVGTAMAGTGSALAFGTQSTAGTYIVQTTSGGGYCATVMTGSAIIVANTTPAVSSSATGSTCSGIAQNYNITSTVAGSTYTWSRAAVSGISNPAVTNQTSNPITEALNNTIAGTVNVNYLIIPSANGCTGNTFTYTVAVNVTPEAPIVATITQPTCIVGSGSITFNGLPMTGTWTITKAPGGTTYTGTGITTTITGLAPGTYTFTVANSGGCISSTTANVVINSLPSPPPTPVVTQNGFILHSSATAGNQWYNQTGLINGAVFQDYTVTANGNYYVIVTLAGCISDTSNVVHITNYSIEDNLLPSKINVYPNPSYDKLFVNFGEIKEIPQGMRLLNELGQIVFETAEPLTVNLSGIDVSHLNAGAYTLQIIFDKGIVNKAVIVK